MSEQKQNQSAQAKLIELQDQMVKRAEELVLYLGKPDQSRGQPERQAEQPDRAVLSKGRTQASKALEVAQSAASLRIFINWLRYQAGREKERGGSEFWNIASGKHTTLATGVTYHLNWLQESMSNVAAHERDQAIMQAATRFLGYFRRALIGAEYLNQIQLAEPVSSKEGK